MKVKWKDKIELKSFALFWAVVFALPPLIYLGHLLAGHDSSVSMRVIALNWIEILPFFLLFCVHNYLIAPLFFKKKYFLYAILTAGVSVAFFQFILKTTGPPSDVGAVLPPPGIKRPFTPGFLKMSIALLLLFVDLGFKAILQMAESEKQMQKMEAEGLSQRLEILRYQVNPHFFMNTLNNIQALILTEPEKATESVSAFSKLMRMVLNQTPGPMISLGRELQYVEQLVRLMRLQLPEGMPIEFDRPQSIDQHALVPSLALVSFVENAFKHGGKSGPEAFIRISVGISAGRVSFRCSNRLAASASPEVEDKDGGLGIANVRSRMELLYPGDYTLEYGNEGDIYNVRMEFPAYSEYMAG